MEGIDFYCIEEDVIYESKNVRLYCRECQNIDWESWWDCVIAWSFNGVKVKFKKLVYNMDEVDFRQRNNLEFLR